MCDRASDRREFHGHMARNVLCLNPKAGLRIIWIRDENMDSPTQRRKLDQRTDPGAASPKFPQVSLLQTPDLTVRKILRADFETLLTQANAQHKTLVPNIVADRFVVSGRLPQELERSDLLFSTGTIVAYGPSDGKYIRVPVMDKRGYRIFLIPHPPEYLATRKELQGRQFVFINQGFEEDGQPVVSLYKDGWYRVLQFSNPDRLGHVVSVHFYSELRGYLNDDLSGVPTAISGDEKRIVMRLDEGVSQVAFVNRFTHLNGHAEFLVHLSMPLDEKVPALIYDAATPAIEDIIT